MINHTHNTTHIHDRYGNETFRIELSDVQPRDYNLPLVSHMTFLHNYILTREITDRISSVELYT